MQDEIGGRQAGGGRGGVWGSLWTPGSWCLVLGQTLLLATGGSPLGAGPRSRCLPCHSPKWGHPGYRPPSALGTSTGKGPRLGRLPAPGGAAGGCRPDVGWAGLCLCLQVLRLVVRVGDWGVLGNTWALLLVKSLK